VISGEGDVVVVYDVSPMVSGPITFAVLSAAIPATIAFVMVAVGATKVVTVAVVADKVVMVAVGATKVVTVAVVADKVVMVAVGAVRALT
jgi:hypothetical protein